MAAAIRVLYVDDESGLLEVGKLFLERSGEFSVTTARSAPEAIGLLNRENFDAIISDYQMPRMDGIQFLVEVRTHFGHIPFILFTGRGREEVVIQAINNGATFYLQKGGDPISQFAELGQKILAAVDLRRADREIIALNRLYTVISATNKAIVRIHEKSELLNEICRIVIEIGGFTMAWAGLANRETHILEPVAAYGHIDRYLDTIAISTEDVPRGRGPTGSAFRKKTFNVCNDIAGDPIMAPWRKAALERGYRSLAAFPFAQGTRNAGVITFYASEPGFFTGQIIRLLDEQSHDLTFAFTIFEHEEQRTAAEKDLTTSEHQYRRLFETAQDAILILDGKSGEIIDANKFILDMLGYPLEYFIGKHLWELGFIKDKSIAQQAFTELKTKGYIRYEDIPLEKSDGRIFNVEFISNVYFVGEKKIIQCNIRDITDRKRAEEALAESDARMNSIIHGSPVAQFVIDKDHRLISWNRTIEEYSGVKEAEVLGKRVPWMVFYDAERPVLADLLVDAKFELLPEWYTDKISKSRFVEGAYEATGFFAKMGTSGMWLYFTAAPIRNARGAIIGAVETLENITDRKKSEDALLLASRKLSVLNDITRHDIMNQLMGLRKYFELSKKDVTDTVFLGYIQKEEQAAEVIQWQIDFARTYHDMGTEAPKWQAISAVISSAVRQLNLAGIEINVNVGISEIFADPLIEKVFYHLMANSLCHGDHVTHMDYSLREAGDNLILIYGDNGAGITAEEKNHLFRKGSGNHTGLGLFLSKEILSITGITITETGEAGKGVRFEIVVPRGAHRTAGVP
ncbi:MAG: PAS domain S-box protein [Methanoregula sp.]|jgi:PAS domain S-box-containing protein